MQVFIAARDIESTPESRILLLSIAAAGPYLADERISAATCYLSMSQPGRSGIPILTKEPLMSRAGAVVFKGKPMTLVGNEVKAGQQAPEFTLHTFRDGQM